MTDEIKRVAEEKAKEWESAIKSWGSYTVPFWISVKAQLEQALLAERRKAYEDIAYMLESSRCFNKKHFIKEIRRRMGGGCE